MSSPLNLQFALAVPQFQEFPAGKLFSWSEKYHARANQLLYEAAQFGLELQEMRIWSLPP